ncbi:MAG: tetraprenyl-beta-curcumene synthase family protein [Firmicutes bacterium]|nr:tetraprenyl-beta-curcumene synthase family protein [Bacillota bacterium]
MHCIQPRVLLRRFISTLPLVKKELQGWACLAGQLTDPLRSQALSSLERKAFHCLGGSVYAHYPGTDLEDTLRLIVAFQTISDYLDNLCDRLNVSDPKAFRLLHMSIYDALTPGAALHDYYQLYPYAETIYLPRLVQTCQKLLGQVPNYKLYQPFTLKLAERYCELQVLKHVPVGGAHFLRDWVKRNSASELEWYEWAAACGSTLGIFLLFALGHNSSGSNPEPLLQAYFPWIQGLHILLDYLIDLEEDEIEGDLNFVSFYPDQKTRDRSLSRFAQTSKSMAKSLPQAGFHRTVVDGLIALYGSDPKVRMQALESTIRLMAEDRWGRNLLRLCAVLRRVGVI